MLTMYILFILPLTHNDDLLKYIDLHDQSWLYWQYVSFSVAANYSDATGTRPFGEVTYTSARNGVHICQKDTTKGITTNILIYKDKMVTRGNRMEVLSTISPRKPQIPIDCNLTTLRRFNWKYVETLSLREIYMDSPGAIKLISADSRQAIVEYNNEELRGTITLDLTKNGVASERVVEVRSGTNSGGKSIQRVVEWHEPAPGYYFPKKDIFIYTDNKSVKLREIVSSINILLSGDKVKDIENWTKPSPNMVFQDAISKIQYKTGADGTPSEKRDLAAYPVKSAVAQVTIIESESSEIFWVILAVILLACIAAYTWHFLKGK